MVICLQHLFKVVWVKDQREKWLQVVPLLFPLHLLFILSFFLSFLRSTSLFLSSYKSGDSDIVEFLFCSVVLSFSSNSINLSISVWSNLSVYLSQSYSIYIYLSIYLYIYIYIYIYISIYLSQSNPIYQSIYIYIYIYIYISFRVFGLLSSSLLLYWWFGRCVFRPSSCVSSRIA